MPKPSESTHESEILLAALELPVDQRDEFLNAACIGRQELKERIVKLLRAAALDGSFMEKPVLDDLPTNMAPTIAPNEVEAVGSMIGPFKLLQAIGEGGMGSVYMAEQIRPVERRVALKIIKAGMDTRQVIARFEAERQALAMMDHPNIAKVLDAGTTTTGRPYFVMELVKGIPITTYCDEKKLTVRQRLELMLSVCNAIQHAHQKGIIHRDIKPGNILVAQYDGKPVPKVIDFGIAKATAQKLTEKSMFTEFGQIIGTLEYMSPEQAEMNQLDIDTRSDVYSLGVLLYELLTGTTPLDSKRMRSLAFVEMLRMIREDDPPRPSNRLSTLDTLAKVAANRQEMPTKLSSLLRGELDWIVLMALEKDRNRRYESANSFAKDIECYLLDEPVAACPPSSTYRFRKFAIRNKVFLFAGTLLALTFCVGMIGTGWQAIRAIRAEAIAQRENREKEIALQAALQSAELERAAREAETEQRKKAEASENEAKRQKNLAMEKSAIADAVTSFLQDDILGQASSSIQARSEFEPDPNITIRTALDRACSKLAERFKNQPSVEAKIRYTIGNSYQALGQYNRAIEQLEASMAIFRKTLGPENPETLESLASLSLSYNSNNQCDKVIELISEHKNKMVFDSERNRIANARLQRILGSAYVNLGDYDTGILILHESHESLKATNTANSRDQVYTLLELSRAFRAAGKSAQALENAELVQSLMSNWMRPEDPDRIGCVWELAMVYQDIGRTAEAIGLLESSYKISIDSRGSEHPVTLQILLHLGRANMRAGRNAEALRKSMEVASSIEKIQGADCDNYRIAQRQVAECHQSLGSPEKALEIISHLLLKEIETKGAEHLDTLNSRQKLGVALRLAKNHEKAIEVLRENYELRAKVQGPVHQQTLSAVNSLAVACWEAGKKDEAIEHLRRARNVTLEQLGAENQRAITLTINLGGYCAQKGAHEEGIEILESIVRFKDSMPTRARMTMLQNLLWAQARTGTVKKENNFIEETIALSREQYKSNRQALTRNLASCGVCLIHLKEWQHAEQLLRESLVLSQQIEPGEWATYSTMFWLGSCLLEQGRLDEAEPLLLEGYDGMKQREDKFQELHQLTTSVRSVERIIQIYSSEKKPEDEEKWHRNLAEIQAMINEKQSKPSSDEK